MLSYSECYKLHFIYDFGLYAGSILKNVENDDVSSFDFYIRNLVGFVQRYLTNILFH